eukprot:3567575-Rhodomonas_salina.4
MLACFLSFRVQHLPRPVSGADQGHAAARLDTPPETVPSFKEVFGTEVASSYAVPAPASYAPPHHQMHKSMFSLALVPGAARRRLDLGACDVQD